jgi:large subunit ribosomal protein L21
VKQTKAPKIVVFKHKRRKGYQKKQGHRQWQTWLRVIDIVSGDAASQGGVIGRTDLDVGITPERL